MDVTPVNENGACGRRFCLLSYAGNQPDLA